VKIALAVIALLLLSVSLDADAQDSRKVEYLTIPYTAANADRTSPIHYSFANNHEANWILNIRNQIIYADNPDAKVVLRLKESAESGRFFEIVMFGAPSKSLLLSINNEDVGYMRLYENNNSWFEGKPVMVSLVQNERMSITDGERNVLDRLRVGPFTLHTIEVYGKDAPDDPDSAIAGQIAFDIISGDPMTNPIMMVPPILAGLAGATVLTLVIIKKRN
jgi:hypothetical protein